MSIQEQAKVRSETFLAANGIKINKTLPLIEIPDDLAPQLPASVARRSLILGYIAFIGFGQPVERMLSEINQWGLYEHTSNRERELLAKHSFTDREKINASWLPECIQSLAWGMGIAELKHLKHCDEDLVTRFPIGKDPALFIQSASLRPFNEIYFQSDLLYRLHWAARDARLNGEKSDLGEGFVSERRKAIDWMLGVSSDWDEIPMDT